MSDRLEVLAPNLVSKKLHLKNATSIHLDLRGTTGKPRHRLGEFSFIWLQASVSIWLFAMELNSLFMAFQKSSPHVCRACTKPTTSSCSCEDTILAIASCKRPTAALPVTVVQDMTWGENVICRMSSRDFASYPPQGHGFSFGRRCS